MKKEAYKTNPEELRRFMIFQRRHGIVPNKKGRGSYDRKNFKKGIDKSPQE